MDKEIIEKEPLDTERLKETEIEELDALFEDEGDPKYQFSKIFYTSGNNLNFITDLDNQQLKAIPKCTKAVEILKDEFDVDFNFDGLLKEIKEEAVSKKREGRKEGYKFTSGGEDENKKKGLLRALGLR